MHRWKQAAQLLGTHLHTCSDRYLPARLWSVLPQPAGSLYHASLSHRRELLGAVAGQTAVAQDHRHSRRTGGVGNDGVGGGLGGGLGYLSVGGKVATCIRGQAAACGSCRKWVGHAGAVPAQKCTGWGL